MGEIAASLFDIGNPELDWVAMAKGFGVQGAHAKDAEDLCRLLEESYKNTRAPLSFRHARKTTESSTGCYAQSKLR